MSGENRVKLSERIYERAKALWPRYLTHPFVTEMADGTLPKCGETGYLRNAG